MAKPVRRDTTIHVAERLRIEVGREMAVCIEDNAEAVAEGKRLLPAYE